MLSMPDYRPTQILGFPHYEISTGDACWFDHGFLSLHSNALGELRQPSVMEGVGKLFPILVPRPFHGWPLWIFLLPERLSQELAQFAHCKPIAYNVSTADLLQNQTFISWPGSTCQLLFKADDVDWTLTRATQIRRILAMFVTHSRTLLTTLHVSGEFIETLWCCSMCAGSNYRPYRVHSDEELAAAKARALAAPESWEFEPDEEGRAPLRLQVITARRRP